MTNRYILRGGEFPADTSIIPLYMFRIIIPMAFLRLPPWGMGSSVWVVLGPIGHQGANASILMLGSNTGALQCTGQQLCPRGLLADAAMSCLCPVSIPPHAPSVLTGLLGPRRHPASGVFHVGSGPLLGGCSAWPQLQACTTLPPWRVETYASARSREVREQLKGG